MGRAAAAQHPRRPRPRRLPAADLHRDDHRPSRGVLRDHRARGARRASAKATSRRCSRRSSATRLAEGTSSHASVSPRRRHPAEAPHVASRRWEGRRGRAHGEEGFSAASSLLYHRHSPSALRSIESLEAPEPLFTANSPLQPHHLRTGELGPGASPDPVLGRRYLLGNDQVAIAFVAASESSPLYRNATGDELVYVHSGEAVLESRVRPDGRRDGRLRGRPEQHDAPVVARRAGRAPGHRGTGPRRPPPQVPQRARPAARGRAVQRARPARARTATRSLVEGEDVPVLVRTRSGLSRARARDPSVRRPRVGRLPLPVRADHPRLRADRRPRPSTAARAPDLHGPRPRHLQLRAAALRLRSRTR